MKNFIIGIDTGGTFTDAVLVERESGRVIKAAKAPTTHHTLSEGTAAALKMLLEKSQLPPAEIEAVAISTTLATNSVVEKKGAEVALLVIGYVKHFKLPVKAVIFVKGGHTITGEEEEPLDIEYLVSLVENLKNEVDAYGVCSAMSFKNPAHELVAEKAISMLDPKPVFCSHRISDQAGMQERAATAGLHAKLMPLMQDFINGVEAGLKRENIGSPMRIIGGNARSIGSRRAVEHAGMTVASGPACTAFFGSKNTKETALVIDLGGTTTDITMLESGSPMFTVDGSQIGDWRTHVEAVDMFTRGIGGDSHVMIDEKNELHIGPRRVAPIASSNFPAAIEDWLGTGGNSKCIDLVPGISAVHTGDSILKILQEQGPCTLSRLQQQTKLSGIPLEKKLENLSRHQCIQETGFTPTDALHVLEEVKFGDVAKAHQAAVILANFLGLSEKEFACLVVERTIEKIENAVLEYITTHYWQKTLANFISTRNNHPVLNVDFALKIPIIGTGAAAKFFLPQVAERLRTTISFPENYEVGNAVGAALIIREEINGKRNP